MNRVLALTNDGKLTYCTASKENKGKGRCNHITHQDENENMPQFMERIKPIVEELNKNAILNPILNNTPIEEREDELTPHVDNEIEFKPYRMSDIEKQYLMPINGRIDLANEDCFGGYIELQEPLWNDMDKKYYAAQQKVPKSYINNVIKQELYIITFVDDELKDKYSVGKIYKPEKMQLIKDKYGDKVIFETGVTGLNKAAKENGFEATKDIYVIPYYMRQDPPGTDSKHPLNSLYNMVIIKRKNIDAQQQAYENLVDNKNSNHPFKTRNGYASDSLSDKLSGKSGIMRAEMTGRSIPYVGRSVIVPDIDQEYGETKIPSKMACEIFKPTIEKELDNLGFDQYQKKLFYETYSGDQRKISQEDRDFLENIITKAGVKCTINRQPSLHRASLFAVNPKISPDGTVHLNPIYETGLGADYDGDQTMINGYNDPVAIKDGLKEIDSRNEDVMRLPRYRSEIGILPTKEAKWGILNILNRRK